MSSSGARTRAELASDYPGNEWRERFLDLRTLVHVLTHSIIGSDFKASDELNRAIALSEAGKRLRHQLVANESVETKDANLLCLLSLTHVEPLIDIERIDMSRLVEAISAMIRERRIIYPMIFGRDLYDALTALAPEERRYLKYSDTMRLLEGKPQGVFHDGHFLMGPFGLHRLEFERDLYPTVEVPLQHCSDIACTSVHRVRLTTSREAGVNHHRSAASRVLRQIAQDPSDWSGFASDLVEDRFNPYEINDPSTLPYLLGDGLSDGELRALLRRVWNASSGRTRDWAAKFGLEGDVAKWAPDLDRASLLNLLLTEPNEFLAEALDAAVLDGDITVPDGEIRRPVVNHRARSGAWQLRSELSSMGYRMIPSSSTVTILRLTSLARTLFDPTSPNEMDDLAWLLRGRPGDTTEDRLESFLRTASPREILSTLVLSREANAKKAADFLGLALGGDDDGFLNAMLWKLGFVPGRRPDIRDAYWANHTRLEKFVVTALAATDPTEEELRSAASNYFVALERHLFDSLIFATWALLTDHSTSGRPFEFHLRSARQFTIETLNSSVKRKDGVERNDLSDGPVLQQLVQGFLRLSNHLESLRGREENYLRQPDEYPRFVKQTDLQRFPFTRTVPYLNLTAASQVGLRTILREVSTKLNDSGILSARNGLLHAEGKQRTPTITEMKSALDRAREVLRSLEEIGCVRATFEVVSSETDQWGRTSTLLRANGTEIRLAGPSTYELLGMPSLHRKVYLMQGAIFAAPNEMLRFREGFDSEYADYWRDFVRRPEPANRASAVQMVDSGADLEAAPAAP
ncbi:hypothetical protein K0817_015415 [Microbacterium sp. HD4P20]|uniref:hypothetical protein n=1 Tax=Microbacterium sp. HD4P20 TaxID=2864874 RepID=UPI001C644C14|nr:hypothetical protein [Microbacterium sp. HD4P20]MCP2637940.1 hypothetical protein [Microbacterium sp. HD4P20]